MKNEQNGQCPVCHFAILGLCQSIVRQTFLSSAVTEIITVTKVSVCLLAADFLQLLDSSAYIYNNVIMQYLVDNC